MTRKELKRLRREDLLEMLIVQSGQLEQVEAELAKCKEELEKRRIAAAETGNIAEAALKLNGIFEAAQKAADEYLLNVKREVAEADGANGAAGIKVAGAEKNADGVHESGADLWENAGKELV